MNIKTAHEIYSLVGGGYNKRHLHGYSWSKEDAEAFAQKLGVRRYYIGVIHVIQIKGRWHRVNVLPVDGLEGDLPEAQDSRLMHGDLPQRSIPSISFQMNDGTPRRLPLDFETSVNTLAGYDEDCQCKLYTLRTGGLLPLHFRVRDLIKSSHTQQQVAYWLGHEINFRLSQNSTEHEI